MEYLTDSEVEAELGFSQGKATPSSSMEHQTPKVKRINMNKRKQNIVQTESFEFSYPVDGSFEAELQILMHDTSDEEEIELEIGTSPSDEVKLESKNRYTTLCVSP